MEIPECIDSLTRLSNFLLMASTLYERTHEGQEATLMAKYVCALTEAIPILEKYMERMEKEADDAVPVVRCGKCKHWRCYGRDFVLEKDYGRCEKPDNESLIKYNASPYDDWFCADGKRKGGDE